MLAVQAIMFEYSFCYLALVNKNNDFHVTFSFKAFGIFFFFVEFLRLLILKYLV